MFSRDNAPLRTATLRMCTTLRRPAPISGSFSRRAIRFGAGGVGCAVRGAAALSQENRVGTQQSICRRAGRRQVHSPLRRDAVAGGMAGLVAGAVAGAATLVQGLPPSVGGFIGLAPSLDGLLVHLAVSVLVGTGFGSLFRYQPVGYAPTVTGGVLYGLLWWIVGPLTLVPVLLGGEPAWSIQTASRALPGLVGHLVYGAITGLCFHLFVTLNLRMRPEPVHIETAPRPPVHQIVILGGGFGGVSAAQRLNQVFARDRTVAITLVSQSNYLLFTPMLAEVAASGLEAQHISAPVRAALSRVRFLHAEVDAVDVAARRVRIRAGEGRAEALSYDHLILALGSVPNFYGLPGLEAHAFTLKTLHDATRLRNHVIALLEQADVQPDEKRRRVLLTFVVAGGGFAGTEMIAELLDLVRGVLRYYPYVRPGETRFVLVHSSDRILPEISAELAAYALRRLKARGIEFRLNTRVAGATDGAVLLNDRSNIPTNTLVWTAGSQPHPLLKTLPCQRNRTGAVIADAMLRVGSLANVWVVGDCAQIPDVLRDGAPCPPTAQHAIRQGRRVAENVAAAIRGRRLEPFRFRTLGTLVALGHRTAVAEIQGWKFSGFLAWFIWRTVYLSRLPGLEKKVRVALDWTIDLFFPRDIVLTGGAATPTLAELVGGPPQGSGDAHAAAPEGDR